MNIKEEMELIEKYAVCPECDSSKIGNGEGYLITDEFVFRRGCKCGWSVKVDRRIKIIASATKRTKGKTIGIYEVSIHGEKTHKYLPAKELKELAGVKRINQFKKVEEWLNTTQGEKWAKETAHVKDF
ncbi:DUF3797 domain-containing protein [Virgibacillus halodenitrificans]|uniref:DUF3797 domain-containing protein n=1 Tax=Virgibacillus halodenitrificans TaxID=1482 RepID=UPI000EF490FE|nr:DUF3797 domain-containing protein [Virgibacillus halodenitrificans]